jgi:hypothetical protein
MADVVKRVQTKDGILEYYSDGNMRLITNGNPSGKEKDKSGKTKPNGSYYIGGGIQTNNKPGKLSAGNSYAMQGTPAKPGENYNTIKSASDAIGWVGNALGQVNNFFFGPEQGTLQNYFDASQSKRKDVNPQLKKQLYNERNHEKYTPDRNGKVPDKFTVVNSKGKKVTVSRTKVMNYITTNCSDGYKALSMNNVDLYEGVAQMMVYRDEGWVDPVIMQKTISHTVSRLANAAQQGGTFNSSVGSNNEALGGIGASFLTDTSRDLRNYIRILNKPNKDAADLSEMRRMQRKYVGDRNKNLQRLQSRYGQAYVDNEAKRSAVKAESVGWKGGYDSSITINYDYNPKKKTNTGNSATVASGQRSAATDIVNTPKEYTSEDNPVQNKQLNNYTVNDYQNEVFDRLYGDKVDAFQQKQNQNLNNRDIQSIVGNMSPDDLRTELWSQGIFHGDVVQRDNLDSVTPQYLNGEAQANLDRRAYNNNQIDQLANQDNTGVLRDAVSNFVPHDAIQNMIDNVGYQTELSNIVRSTGNPDVAPYVYNSPINHNFDEISTNNDTNVNPMVGMFADSLNNMGNAFARANEQAQLNAIAYNAGNNEANPYTHVDPFAQIANDRLEQLQMSAFDQAVDLERKNQALYDANNLEFNKAIRGKSREEAIEMYRQFKNNNGGRAPKLM